MRKTVYVFIVLFILATIMVGCNSDKEVEGTTVQQPKESQEKKEPLDKPVVYLDGMDISNNEETIFFDEARLIFTFNSSSINKDVLDKVRVTSENAVIKVKEMYGNSSILMVLDSTDYEPFSIIIESGLKDANGKILEENFIVNLKKVVEPKTETMAAIKLITKNGKVDVEQIYELILSNAHKEFEVTFTNPMDKDSFEKSIITGMKHKVDIEFDWIDDKHVLIKMKNFESGEYAFRLSYAKDMYGRPFYNQTLIRFSITPITVSLISDSETYELNSYTNYYLTNTPKVFEASFMYPINKESFETSVRAGNDQVNIKFEWMDSTHVRFEMMDLENGDNKIGFNTYDVVDMEGNPINKGVYYSLSISPQITTYSLSNEGELNKVDIDYPKDIMWGDSEFIMKDKVIATSISDIELMSEYDVQHMYYDLENQQVIHLNNYPAESNSYTYKDLFARDDYYLINGKVYSLDGKLRTLANSQEATAQKIDKIHKDKGIFTSFKYTYPFADDLESMSLTIYDKSEDKLQTFDLGILNLVDYIGTLIKIQYIVVDNKTMILEGLSFSFESEIGPSYDDKGNEILEYSFDKRNLHIYKLDLDTGELTQIIKSGHSPIYINENKFLYTDTDGTLRIADLDGNVIEELPIICDEYHSVKENDENKKIICDEYQYLNGNIIGLNNESIIIYNIDTKEKKVIPNTQKLKIIGVGESKVYLAKRPFQIK